MVFVSFVDDSPANDLENVADIIENLMRINTLTLRIARIRVLVNETASVPVSKADGEEKSAVRVAATNPVSANLKKGKIR